ncbi:MAG: DUF6655 family protein [Stellaceae bacterium]
MTIQYRFARAFAVAAVTLALTGCVTERETNPPQTAMEQLLISSAADRAANKLRLDLPRGTRLYIDAHNFGTSNGNTAEAHPEAHYAIAAATAALLRQGFAVMPNRKAADVIVALRSGALSIDDKTTLLGIPAIPIPVPFAGTFTTPQIAFYQSDVSRGIAKLAAIGYGARNGLLRARTGAKIGTATHIQRTVLFFFGSTTNNLTPPAVNKYK